MMNILYVITGLGLGGAEKVVSDLADQMVALGHTVKIAYLTGDVLVKPVSQNIEIVALQLNSINSFFAASIRYKKLVKMFHPDIVHAHMVHANIFARLNRVVCRVPKLICTAHSSNEGGKVRMFAYRLTNSLSDLNTNVSIEATNSLIAKNAFPKDGLITVYNGIDIDKFKSKSDMKKSGSNILTIVAVGRFNEAKDYPNLVHAFSILKRKITINIKLNIIGDGELRPQIENLIQDLGLSDSVSLLGRRSDIPHLLNQSDIFVLSSKHEGLPTVVIEAMACMCYVVATDCGGSAEILGDTGKLVPIQNSQALAYALEEAVNLSENEREYNNKKARMRIEQLFSLQTSVKQWLNLYET